MRYQEKDGTYHIFVELDAGEKEIDVLRSIVKASFELAPKDLDAPEKIETLSDKEADAFILDKHIAGDVIVGVDNWQGRWCVTYLVRIKEGEFILSNAFQQMRGIPILMLERARLNLALMLL